MTEANGVDLDRAHGLREAMIELIKITEGFYACGVAASVYCQTSEAGIVTPDAVFSNIGKLLLATQIYDMQRLAHQVSGGMIVALPGPDEDHNPATAGRLSEVLTARSDIPYEKRIEVARFIEDLTASYQAGWYSVISLHGGGSPEAMKLRDLPQLPDRQQGRPRRAPARPRRARGRDAQDHAQSSAGTVLRHRLHRPGRAADGRVAAAAARRARGRRAAAFEIHRRRLNDASIPRSCRGGRAGPGPARP